MKDIYPLTFCPIRTLGTNFTTVSYCYVKHILVFWFVSSLKESVCIPFVFRLHSVNRSEKNMMSRFIELLRSPPSRYQANNGSGSNALRSSGQSSNLQTWGTNGGLDAMVKALTWGGDVLRIGQQQQNVGAGSSGRVEVAGVARGTEERSSAQVQVQVIQTTSILVMNVKSDT